MQKLEKLRRDYWLLQRRHRPPNISIGRTRSTNVCTTVFVVNVPQLEFHFIYWSNYSRSYPRESCLDYKANFFFFSFFYMTIGFLILPNSTISNRYKQIYRRGKYTLHVVKLFFKISLIISLNYRIWYLFFSKILYKMKSWILILILIGFFFSIYLFDCICVLTYFYN